jgi:hypothetical protein
MNASTSLILGLTVVVAEVPAGASKGGLSTSHTPVGSVAAIIATGTTDASGLTTYIIDSIDQEYAVLAALGLEPNRQSLIFGEDGTAHDLFETSGGPVRFDISSFFSQGF